MAISQHSVVFVTFTHFGTSSETLSEGLPPGRRSVSSELERTASGQHHAPGQHPWEGGMSDGTTDAPRPVTRTPRPVLPDSAGKRTSGRHIQRKFVRRFLVGGSARLLPTREGAVVGRERAAWHGAAWGRTDRQPPAPHPCLRAAGHLMLWAPSGRTGGRLGLRGASGRHCGPPRLLRVKADGLRRESRREARGGRS